MSHSEGSFAKRAAAELSRCFNGFNKNDVWNIVTLTESPGSVDSEQKQSLTTKNEVHISCNHNSGISNVTSPTVTPGCNKQFLSSNRQTSASGVKKYSESENHICHLTNKLKPLITRLSPTSFKSFSSSSSSPSSSSSSCQRMSEKNSLTFQTVDKSNPLTKFSELLMDPIFFNKFTSHFSPKELSLLAQVCKKWKNHLYSRNDVWCQLTFTINYKLIRQRERVTWPLPSSSSWSSSSCPSSSCKKEFAKDSNRLNLYKSLDERSFVSICITGASDADVIDLVSHVTPAAMKRIKHTILKETSVTDNGLDIFLAALNQSLISLQLIGCNEISDSGLWTRLVPSLQSLTIKDCINVADETVAAVSQMLPHLKEFTLQAYHSTDCCLEFLATGEIGPQMQSFTLDHCWEISDQGIVSLAHSMKNLTSLSLTGCSKITDDAIEVITEQLRQLKSLDLSWCPRITDTSLEYIAYDLSDCLTHLNLDRCPLITDVALGYASIMPNLMLLSIRWCPLVTDKGLLSLSSMKSLTSLALSGCQQVTEKGLFNLLALTTLEELEVTNCPGATQLVLRHIESTSHHKIIIFT